MAVQQFELFHGAAIVKLLRKKGGNPPTLRMIETNPSQDWATYELNGELSLFLKLRTTSRLAKDKARTWTFQFPRDKLELLSGKRYAAVLICGVDKLDAAGQMETCLLQPDELKVLLDLTTLGDAQSRSISVRCQPGSQLHVTSPQASDPIVVARRALDVWEVPGS